MHSDSTANGYEQALAMADAGQHEQALEQIVSYLQSAPGDGKAFNDAGTLLFCLKRGREAIVFFEKALQLCKGDDRTQVYWNLCEACLQEGYPEKAVALFAVMHQNEILNIDTVNRTADVFLQKNQLGRAIEVLKCSLKLAPNQEVLGPMIEAIRGNRQTAMVISDDDSFISQTLATSLDSLIPTRRRIGDRCDRTSEAIHDVGFSIFVGIGNVLLDCLQRNGLDKKILILNEQDLSSPFLGQVDFSKIDDVVACTDAEWIEYLRQQAPSLTVIRADAVPNPETLPLYDKKQGKRIAAVGPWNARANPMFLLQCFQKLHYLDADTRLYLAGDFEDPTLERYMTQMIEAMELDNIVFLDGPVKNLPRWLKDKHYIVSTAIDASALGGVWAGAACGLMPLVHRFAAVDEMFDSEFVFDLAEDFFRLIHNSDYDPKRFRRIAQERFDQGGLSAAVHTLLCKMESQMPTQIPSMKADPASAPMETTESPGRSMRIPVKRTDPFPCMTQEQGLSIEAIDPAGASSFCGTN